MRHVSQSLVAALALLGTSCREAGPEPQPEPAEVDAEQVQAEPVEQPGASIMRPEVEAEAEIEAPPEPLTASLPFPEEGFEPSPAARSQLMALLQSPQLEPESTIVLRGHSDSTGSDRANLAASQQRAEAIRDILLEQGVAAERIKVIALGEMRPVAPNAHLDGSPDLEGRARNRRVEIEILPVVQPEEAPVGTTAGAVDKAPAPAASPLAGAREGS